jgi:hypothetical protein
VIPYKAVTKQRVTKPVGAVLKAAKGVERERSITSECFMYPFGVV